jgi:hypothetical protein
MTRLTRPRRARRGPHADIAAAAKPADLNIATGGR